MTKKKLAIVLMILVSISTGVFAQKGEKSIGGSLLYGSEIESLGIGARFQYGITDQIRIAPSINYFLPNNNLSMFEINADVHYLFPIQDNISIYPLAGLVYDRCNFSFDDLGYGTDVSTSSSEFGLNLGVGGQYGLTENLNLNLELKYVVSDFDQFVVSAGVTYKF